MKTETIEWKRCEEELPDSDITVLVFCPLTKSEPVWMGYYDGARWLTGDHMEMKGRDEVKAWAHVPEGRI